MKRKFKNDFIKLSKVLTNKNKREVTLSKSPDLKLKGRKLSED
jgi:hypothetical protein